MCKYLYTYIYINIYIYIYIYNSNYLGDRKDLRIIKSSNYRDSNYRGFLELLILFDVAKVNN